MFRILFCVMGVANLFFIVIYLQTFEVQSELFVTLSELLETKTILMNFQTPHLRV